VAIAERKILGYSDDLDSLIKEFGSIKGLYVDLITPDNLIWIL
jgi:hypothetical protein